MDALLDKTDEFYRLDCSQDFNLSATKLSLPSSKWPTALLLVLSQILILIMISGKIAANQYSNIEHFIEFQPGNYQQHVANSLEPVLQSLEQIPKNQTIKINN